MKPRYTSDTSVSGLGVSVMVVLRTIKTCDSQEEGHVGGSGKDEGTPWGPEAAKSLSRVTQWEVMTPTQTTRGQPRISSISQQYGSDPSRTLPPRTPYPQPNP